MSVDDGPEDWPGDSGGGASWLLGKGASSLQFFLRQNLPKLLRDLMGVVNLETVNHENICCLNTAVLILIIAHQHGQLAQVLQQVRQLAPNPEPDEDSLDYDGGDIGSIEDSDEEHTTLQGLPNRTTVGGKTSGATTRMSVEGEEDKHSSTSTSAARCTPQSGTAVLAGFRRLLWFWCEYYSRGGRDRLSLEFSSHVKFWAWRRVVGLLCADDSSDTSLVSEPIPLPQSPYELSPRPRRRLLPIEDVGYEHVAL
ncbi:unnamed protein product [Choristocarpus tenellus]